MNTRDIPAPGADASEWQECALEFDGYGYAGGHHALDEMYGGARRQILAGEKLSGDHDFLRAVLFMHQRYIRWSDYFSPEEWDVENKITDAILTALNEPP